MQFFERSAVPIGAAYSFDANNWLADADAAASGSAGAFLPWSQMPPLERSEHLLAMAKVLDARRDEFVEICAAEVGASENWTLFNVNLACEVLRNAATLTPLLADQATRNETAGTSSIVRRQAAGVVLGIVPWNAPIVLGARAIASPLICGNTVIMKGSEFCPRTHELLVEVFNSAGLPEGVLNCVIGEAHNTANVVSHLIAHPAVRRVNFTGSTRVGREVAVEAAQNLKPVVLELSGKAPILVLADADLDAAVEAACFGAYFNQGQVCMSTEWIVVVDAVADEFVDRLASRVQQIKAKDPAGADAQLGPMISVDAVARVEGLIADAVENGAILLAGGDSNGIVMQPVLLDRIASNMRIFKEESFGPVASVLRVTDAEEAISLVNDSRFGLSAAIFSQDLKAAHAIADRLECGIVQINGPTVHDDPAMPFGGMKDSGYGRFGGESAIEAFTELRWIATHDAGRTPTL